MDFLTPTGSFKDRGAKYMINWLKRYNINEVVEDSSGNAGASIAAYCSAANIKCSIFLPESTSTAKIKQIAAYGAKIIKISGSRDAVSKIIGETAKRIYYASHIFNPLFIEGVKSIAYELYEEMGIPDYIFIPTGNGTLLLGVYLGFLEIGKLPKIVSVQSKNCSPIYNEYHNIRYTYVKETIAEGIAVSNPVRMNEIIEAIKKSQGDIINVSEEEIKQAHNKLAKNGIYVEYTSATALAGVDKYFKNRSNKGIKIVIPLTGIGLKN